jgi:hypothetical protein
MYWGLALLVRPLEPQTDGILCGQHATNTTLLIVFSVTYYLELCNAVTIYCISHLSPTKVKLVVRTL